MGDTNKAVCTNVVGRGSGYALKGGDSQVLNWEAKLVYSDWKVRVTKWWCLETGAWESL